jgi:hypothetical protein
MYCLIKPRKLRELKFDPSIKQKISRLEQLLNGVHTTFTVKQKGKIHLIEGTIGEGIKFFREHNIEDKFIYELLQSYYDTSDYINDRE